MTALTCCSAIAVIPALNQTHSKLKKRIVKKKKLRVELSIPESCYLRHICNQHMKKRKAYRTQACTESYNRTLLSKHGEKKGVVVCSGMSWDDKRLMSCVCWGQEAAEALQLFQFWSEVVFLLIIPTAHSRRMRSRAEGRSMPIIFRVRNLIKPDQIQAELQAHSHSFYLAFSQRLPPSLISAPCAQGYFDWIYAYYE